MIPTTKISISVSTQDLARNLDCVYKKKCKSKFPQTIPVPLLNHFQSVNLRYAMTVTSNHSRR